MAQKEIHWYALPLDATSLKIIEGILGDKSSVRKRIEDPDGNLISVWKLRGYSDCLALRRDPNVKAKYFRSQNYGPLINWPISPRVQPSGKDMREALQEMARRRPKQMYVPRNDGRH